MTASAKTAGPTREEFAERLLKGSVKKSYAPVVDIDWDAPLDPDKFFLPPKTVSLYGTPHVGRDDAASSRSSCPGRNSSTPCRRASGSRTSSTRRCCAT